MKRMRAVNAEIVNVEGVLQDVTLCYGDHVRLNDGRCGAVAAMDGDGVTCRRLVLVLDEGGTAVLEHGDAIAFHVCEILFSRPCPVRWRRSYSMVMPANVPYYNASADVSEFTRFADHLRRQLIAAGLTPVGEVHGLVQHTDGSHTSFSHTPAAER